MPFEEITLRPNTEFQFTNSAFVSDDANNSRNNYDQAQGRKNSKNKCDFDDLLPHIGEFGLYQKILFILMIPYAFFLVWIYFTQFFITLLPDEYWCWIPELANLTEKERLKAIPLTPSGDREKCKMYDINFAQDTNKNYSSFPIVACKSGWEYNNTEIPYRSIAAEFNWVCDRATFPSTAQSIFFCGSITGGLFFGWLSDKYGRIPALVGTNLIGFIGGIATPFSNSFWSFCVCRFLVGMAYDYCFTMMYVIVLEYVGPTWRTFVANLSIGLFFTFASTILPWCAYYIADWRILCFVTAAPLSLALITPWIIPESARWLVSQGKIDRALKIVREIEKTNGAHVDEEVYENFKKSCNDAMKLEENTKSDTVFDLFKTPRLRKITILLILMWMAIALVFDGHVRNVGSLGLDVFLTSSIACFTEFPADLSIVLFMESWGRRWFAFGSLVSSGLFCFLATAVPFGIPSAILALCGRFSVNIAFNIGLQYAAELLPTVVRGQGIALIHIMGYFSSIISPFVVYLAKYSVNLPLWILGFLGIFGGILCLFLPETTDQLLPETLQDGENFGVDQKFWNMPCLKRNG